MNNDKKVEMAPMKMRINYDKIAKLVIGVIAVVFLWNFFGPGNRANSQKSSNAVAPEKLIEFSNVTMKKAESYTDIVGEVKNNNKIGYTFNLTITFYDQNKKIIETSKSTVFGLGPGDTKTFTSMASKDLPLSSDYKIQVDVITPAE